MSPVMSRNVGMPLGRFEEPAAVRAGQDVRVDVRCPGESHGSLHRSLRLAVGVAGTGPSKPTIYVTAPLPCHAGISSPPRVAGLILADHDGQPQPRRRLAEVGIHAAGWDRPSSGTGPSASQAGRRPVELLLPPALWPQSLAAPRRCPRIDPRRRQARIGTPGNTRMALQCLKSTL